MKIRILGGGPGGLYAAILAKKRHPDWDVALYERNGPSDTFGFGVVFSDETLDGFEHADPESYAEIASRFVRWTDIDTFAKGECVRSTGHGFCGIARVKLLELLQSRARSLGVELHFEREFAHTDFPDADLIIAADGINSKTRAALSDVFKPTIEWGRAPFIWLGTDKKLDAFTFIFRENQHGTFQVHAYPFSAERGTFIVETDDQTFAKAGLENMSSEQSVAYLEQVFADDLQGARLISNKSDWIRFRRVVNQTWRAGNVVLIGDAAHTAHFSIGSGTKLAMEDAMTLVNALDASDSVAEALANYEQARWVDAAKLQRTAKVSQGWFEHAGLMFRNMEPLQLVTSMMTRSARVTHENLRLRDPALVSKVDAWFSTKSGVGHRPHVTPPMFTPFKLRELVLENRVVVSPMCQYSAKDGTVDEYHLAHLGARAVGGAGLVMTEMTNVSAEGRITHGCAGLYDDAHVAAWKRIVEFVHRTSRARIGIQLGHAGRKGSTTRPWEGKPDQALGSDGWEVMAPSAIRYRFEAPLPRPMTRPDMIRVCEEHVRSTHMAERAGFDLLEIHMAHGYLLSSFISPLSNQRNDEYGGSLDNRMRFPLEVLRAVRAGWPAHKPLTVRISACDWAPGGIVLADAVEIARLLKANGCDLVDVSTGQTCAEAQPEYGRMFQAPFSNVIRHAVGVPTMAVGAIQGWDHINTLIASGRADLCALARPHLADPYLTLHAAQEQGFTLPWPVQYAAAQPKSAQ
jgi:anthraniloyl-CoA monooxygenase